MSLPPGVDGEKSLYRPMDIVLILQPIGANMDARAGKDTSDPLSLRERARVRTLCGIFTSALSYNGYPGKRSWNRCLLAAAFPQVVDPAHMDAVSGTGSVLYFIALTENAFSPSKYRAPKSFLCKV